MNNAEPKRLILQNTVSLSNMRLNLDTTEARVNKYCFVLLRKKKKTFLSPGAHGRVYGLDMLPLIRGKLQVCTDQYTYNVRLLLQAPETGTVYFHTL